MGRDLIVGMPAAAGFAKDPVGSGMEDGLVGDGCVEDLRYRMKVTKSQYASVFQLGLDLIRVEGEQAHKVSLVVR